MTARALDPATASAETRLTEVAELLAVAILRHRAREQRRLRNSRKGREKGLDVLSETRTHGQEVIHCGA